MKMLPRVDGVAIRDNEIVYVVVFFFQAEDGIRDGRVTGVQTCALPIWGLNRVAFETSIKDEAGPVLIDAEVKAAGDPFPDRSEERRVGKECRCRWAPYH